MAWEFQCQSAHRYSCSAPVCPCPRVKTHMDITEEAKEALEIIEFLKENGSIEVENKYLKTESYIRDSGVVNFKFLQRLRKEKQKIQTGKNA